MAFQPAICSNCGGKILVDDVDLNGFAECECCHTSHKVIDIITIDGLPTAKTYLMNADNAVEDGDLDKAFDLYRKILEIKPNCHEAYWGLYSCQCAFDSYYGYRDKYGNSGPLTKAAMMSNALDKYAYRAIKFAPSEQAAKYRLAIKDAENFVAMAKSGQLDQSARDLKGNSNTGCYIATAVYGSYTCTEVMELRRFRDDVLSKHSLGRIFIRFYYTVSPYLIRYIKPDSMLEKGIRRFLDYFRGKVRY